MNWFSAIKHGVKGLFGRKEGGASSVMEVARGIGGFIDEQKFTPEEQAKMHAEVTIPAFQKYMESTVGENTERSITRRTLAIWVIKNWFLMLWVAIFAYGVELIMDRTHEFSGFVLGIAVIPQLLYLVLGVGAFFFGAHINRDMPWSKSQTPK